MQVVDGGLPSVAGLNPGWQVLLHVVPVVTWAQLAGQGMVLVGTVTVGAA